VASERPVVIVKTGTTVPGVAERRGDFDDWIRDGMGLPDDALQVVSVFRGDALPEPRRCGAVVITGSAALVTDREDWSERTAAWLPGVVEAGVPVLGICYGHQLLAHGLGGRVGRNPRGREIGTAEVRFATSGDPLLGELDGAAHFQVSHIESVLELPPTARLLAHNEAELHHAFAIGDRVWGIQFHPEFDEDIMRGYIDARWDQIADDGLDPVAIRDATRETPDGPRLLARFREIADQLRGKVNDDASSGSS
jgi:GMP synthase (glutamine-hydrolysing)